MLESNSQLLLKAYIKCVNLLYIRSLWDKNSRSCHQIKQKIEVWNNAILENSCMQLSCVWKKSFKSSCFGATGTFYVSNQRIFYGETAELFKSWIPVLYPQISCKIRAWANGVKLADNAFRWKDTFKKHSCCALISGITYTSYICNQSIFSWRMCRAFQI